MKRPFVYINMAMTADGKITSAFGEYPRFTSAFDRTNMDRLRAMADALLVGAGTIRADNPVLRVRDEGMQRHRRELGKPDGLMKVLVTASAEIDTSLRFFTDDDGGRLVVATVDNASPARLQLLEGKAEIWKVGRDRVDMARLLNDLHEEGVEKLLAEGGGETNWRLIRDDLVDEIYLTVAPSLLGGSGAPTIVEGEGFYMRQQRTLRLLEVQREGDELYCRYAVVR
jgi:2,5-diamino-6-(ribosylamino)-4(3H)-pyrimidinone 5'-phosphate reductase